MAQDWSRLDLDAFAATALARWPFHGAIRAELINLSENATFLVYQDDKPHSVLRMHRHGYHPEGAIESELAWVNALAADRVVRLAQPIYGANGSYRQRVTFDGDTHDFVLFDYLDGEHRADGAKLTDDFHLLGQEAAKTHSHSASWKKPSDFNRFHWDVDAVFGATPRWGKWRDGPNLSEEGAKTLALAQDKITAELARYGQSNQRYGLIHGDMRLANLLFDAHGPQLIDFDDCGFSWFVYDFAAAVSFIETRQDLAQLCRAWCAGYQTHRALTDIDIAMMPTMVMFRRLALLAWIGSHIDAPEPQILAPGFAKDTVALARSYLEDDFLITEKMVSPTGFEPVTH